MQSEQSRPLASSTLEPEIRGRVLIVEADTMLRSELAEGLAGLNFEIVSADTGEQALSLLATSLFDVVLADLQLPGISGLELCRQAQKVQPGLAFTLLTRSGNFENAVEAIRAGVWDFLPKPMPLETIVLSLDRAIKHRRVRLELKSLRKQLRATDKTALIGDSLALRQVDSLISRVAQATASVLITGESGTGKELAAQALHQRSDRHKEPFVALNCAAIPEALVESELFGHVRGAFTGANTAQKGLLVSARGGTLFLDEVGELPLTIQAKLLRALESRKVRPVGGQQEFSFDARIVSATNRDLEHEVSSGRFRQDLFYRLNVIQIDLPPLRVRGNDKLLLAQTFIDNFAAHANRSVSGLSPEAAEKILKYSWPGNVRELKNCIERAVALTEFDQIAEVDLPTKIRASSQPASVKTEFPLLNPTEELVPLQVVERRYIQHVLSRCGQNRSLAARILGVDRKTLRRKLKQWETDDTISQSN